MTATSGDAVLVRWQNLPVSAVANVFPDAFHLSEDSENDGFFYRFSDSAGNAAFAVCKNGSACSHGLHILTRQTIENLCAMGATVA